MNFTSKNGQKNIPWIKFGIIAAVLIGVAVFSGRAGIEKILNLKPGTLGGNRTATNSRDDDSSDSPKFDVDTNWKNSGGAGKTSDSDFRLERDGYVLRSPEGLTYYVGDRGENRYQHVLDHAKDDRSKPVHGVFALGENEIFETIDEAYRLVKSGSRKVLNTKPDRERVAYDIEMDRKIGRKGGRNGKGQTLTVLRLVLEKETRVITAFPAR